jgi:hypothetical protein
MMKKRSVLENFMTNNQMLAGFKRWATVFSVLDASDYLGRLNPPLRGLLAFDELSQGQVIKSTGSLTISR